MELPSFPIISSIRLRSSITFPYSYAVEERRLPAAREAHDGDHLAAGYREIHLSQRMDAQTTSPARNAIAARRFRTSEGSAAADGSGSCIHISHRKTPAKSAAPPRVRRTRVGVGSDSSTTRIG